ncbi:hypothetical protein H4F18_07495 [Vibrio scophthalmi]|uniref:hypothetical protein n=1 Tax=Vibrio scophthalmi TaxID=45658 RepID=UPI002FEEC8D0
MNKQDRKAIGYANAIIAMLDGGINDAASYRIAIDSIFCHVFGHVTKSDQRALTKYNKAAPVSKGVMLNPKEKRIIEHVVPITVIYREIETLPHPTADDVIDVIARLYKIRVVTAREDARLNALGLSHAMPPEFYQPSHPLFGDWEARHKIADILDA